MALSSSERACLDLANALGVVWWGDNRVIESLIARGYAYRLNIPCKARLTDDGRTLLPDGHPARRP